MFWWRKTVAGTREMDISVLQKEGGIRDKKKLIISSVCLGLVLVFFFFTSLLHVEPAWIALAGATLLMLLTYPKHIEVPLSGVEWNMLLFFAALFVFINAVGQLGIIRMIADLMATIISPVPSNKQLYLAMTVILWVSGVLSSVLSSIPTTTMLIPVVQEMFANPSLSLPLRPLIWALSLGSCLGGNGTIIGAASNLVVSGVVRSKGYYITFVSFAKVSVPLTLLLIAVANVYLIVVYGALKWGW